MCAAFVIRRHIQTRKIIHISFGAVYVYFFDKLSSVGTLTIYDKAFFSSGVMLFTALFVSSYFIKQLVPVCNLLLMDEQSGSKPGMRRAPQDSLDGVAIYGALFFAYTFCPARSFRAGLLCLCFGDGLAPYGNFRHRQGKTAEGSAVFFAAAFAGLLAFQYGYPEAMAYAAACTLVERFIQRYDNLLIPCGALLAGAVLDRIQ